MMEMEEAIINVVEWRIENLSHWRTQVHGECIRSPKFYIGYCLYNMTLYPKGFGEHVAVRFCGDYTAFSGDIAFYGSDGALICEQRVLAKRGESLHLPPGPKFEDVLSRIRESKDFLSVRLRIQDQVHYEQRIRTTISVFKVDLEISHRWIEDYESSGVGDVFHIENDFIKGLILSGYCSENKLHYSITPIIYNKTPFTVEMRICWKRSDGTLDKCVEKEHVFCDNSPWEFIDAQETEEFVRKRMSLLLNLKITTSNLIWSFNLIHNYRSVSQGTEDEGPPSSPDSSSKTDDSVTTKDSGSQTSDMPADSVLELSKELMCLYQDQDFSDFQLKCGNVSFPVHKNILSARSPVFKTMLSTDMTEAASGQVVIDDLDPSTLSRFLTYLYTGAVEDLGCDSALKLYYAADKYQVSPLKRECAEFLCSNVSISNVCDILTLADKHGEDELTAASHNFILDNFNAVLKSKEWDTLRRSEPILVANTVTQFAVDDRVVRKHQETQ